MSQSVNEPIVSSPAELPEELLLEPGEVAGIHGGERVLEVVCAAEGTQEGGELASAVPVDQRAYGEVALRVCHLDPVPGQNGKRAGQLVQRKQVLVGDLVLRPPR